MEMTEELEKAVDGYEEWILNYYGRDYLIAHNKKAIEKGRQEGREEGRQEGREEGRQEGREEGRQEGREEGSVKMITNIILNLIKLQYPLHEIELIVKTPRERIVKIAQDNGLSIRFGKEENPSGGL